MAASGADDINFLAVAAPAAVAVSKLDKPRIFDPDTNQSANAWQVDYRRYHDMWIPDNKKGLIYVNTK